MADVDAGAGDALKEFYTHVKEATRDAEVERYECLEEKCFVVDDGVGLLQTSSHWWTRRVLTSFRLNPYDILDLRMDATETQVSKQFRKVSLLIHPDKCTHAKAKEAFEVANAAYKMLQNDQDMRFTHAAIEQARNAVLAEREKEVKRDNALRTLHRLRPGEEEEWMNSDEYHFRWKQKAQKFLTDIEWKRRRADKRMREEEERVRREADEEKQKLKKAQEQQKTWEEAREERIGGWRQFIKAKEAKKKRKKADVLGAI